MTVTEPDRRGAAELSAAGLDADEQALYERLVEGPALTVDELGDAAAALARAGARGLVREVAGQYLPVPPDVAADILLGPHERALSVARRHIEALSTEYRISQSGGEGGDVLAIYSGVNAMEERLAQVRSVAQRELRCLVRGGERADCPAPDPDVPCRAVLDWWPERSTTAQARFRRDMPATLYLADDRLAVIPVRLIDDAYAIVVFPSDLLTALESLFEEVWARAEPMGSTMDGSGRDGSFDQLPEMLLAGMTDKAIARQLGVGYRTAQRRIAMLMHDLGARTRFQAGVQAALQEIDGSLPAGLLPLSGSSLPADLDLLASMNGDEPDD